MRTSTGKWFRTCCRCALTLSLVFGMMFTSVIGQEGTARLFDEANILYQQEDYVLALGKYGQIEQQGFVSSALFYNIANCYYKQNQIGKAILYYERARRLDPRDEDVNANLEIANLATIDKITPPPEFVLGHWLRASLYFIPVATVLRLVAILYLSVTTLTMVFILLSQESLRARIRSLLIVAAAFLIATVSLAGLQWWDSVNRAEAVVQTDQISAKSSPGEAGVEIFTVHEGTKVRIDQETEAWVEIVLPDGKAGWVPSNALEII